MQAKRFDLWLLNIQYNFAVTIAVVVVIVILVLVVAIVVVVVFVVVGSSSGVVVVAIGRGLICEFLAVHRGIRRSMPLQRTTKITS